MFLNLKREREVNEYHRMFFKATFENKQQERTYAKISALKLSQKCFLRNIMISSCFLNTWGVERRRRCFKCSGANFLLLFCVGVLVVHVVGEWLRSRVIDWLTFLLLVLSMFPLFSAERQ